MPPLAVLKVLDVVPGWAYALIVAGLLLVIGADRIALADAHRDAAVATAQLQGDRAAAQKGLAQQTARVLVATNQLNEMRLAQEKRDGEAQATIAQLREDLRRRSRAAGGPGLRDFGATTSGCGVAAASAGSASDGGGAGKPEAGRLLSESLENLLLKLASDADEINVAYASCREDAIRSRKALSALDGSRDGTGASLPSKPRMPPPASETFSEERTSR